MKHTHYRRLKTYGKSPIQNVLESIHETMYGFPYSRHRSARIKKKLMQRSQPKYLIKLPVCTPTPEQLKAWRQEWRFAVRNDAADALRYMMEGCKHE